MKIVHVQYTTRAEFAARNSENIAAMAAEVRVDAGSYTYQRGMSISRAPAGADTTRWVGDWSQRLQS